MKSACSVIALLLSLVACFAAESPSAAPSASPKDIDWASFLDRHDLVWASNPTAWEEAPFIGNGNLGATMYLQDGAFSWEVNRADFAHNGSRYPMGHVTLVTLGKITGGELRLELWNAEAHGTVQTDRGRVQWRSFVAAKPNVIAIEVEGLGDESAVTLGWVPASATSPDKIARKAPVTEADLQRAAVIEKSTDGFTSVQSFNDGGAYAIALHAASAEGPKRTYFLTIESAATSEEALANAQRVAADAATTGLPTIEAAHRTWWHGYYPASFVSFPDARLESFYWIQIYKLGSAMRADGPILDLMGPWYRKSPWLRIWFNLNVQLTYSPLATANRLAQAESLYGALDRGTPALVNNVPPKLRPNAAVIGRSASYDLVRGINLSDPNRSQAGSEAGNLPWTMYYYWQYATYQNDDTILRHRVFPLLKLAINHYLAYLERDASGHYHLPPTLSPELVIVPDCNYDLALLRWGCATLVETAERLKINDPLLAQWRDVLANLTPFPVDDTGLMIGRDRPLRESHRHYSHLLAIYPLHVITPDRSGDRALIEKSLAHWTSMPDKFRGFSYTGASSMYSLLGDGDKAVDFLHQLLEKVIKPNTFYTEAGPVIETPLSGATSVQDMLLQSWGGKVRVFPAVPAAWEDVSFATLRAEGGYLVSAVRHAGRTAWVSVEYSGHEPNAKPCHLLVPDWKSAFTRNGGAAQLESVGAGEFIVNFAQPDRAVLLAPTADEQLPSLAPVANRAAEQNPYPQHYKSVQP
jgi:alpha-L-fucosidase 2